MTTSTSIPATPAPTRRQWSWRHAIVRDPDLDRSVRLLLLVLASSITDAGEIIAPEIDDLVAAMLMGRRAVSRHLKRAAAAGYLEIDPRRSPDGRVHFRPRFPAAPFAAPEDDLCPST